MFSGPFSQPKSFAVTIDATISVADAPAEAIREFAEKHIG